LWIGIALIILIVVGYLAAIILPKLSSRKSMRSSFFDDGTISLRKNLRLSKKRFPPRRKESSSLPPQPPLTDKDINSLANKVADKLKDAIRDGLIPSEEVGKAGTITTKDVDKEQYTLVQIDETLVDTGVDITGLEGKDISVQEEEKVDDLSRSRKKLSELLKRK